MTNEGMSEAFEQAHAMGITIVQENGQWEFFDDNGMIAYFRDKSLYMPAKSPGVLIAHIMRATWFWWIAQ
jgi:hypothetical protein